MQFPRSKFVCQYPPPTKSTVQRISEHLLTMPAFYVNVLDLMRNMGLPAPFYSDDSAKPVAVVAEVDSQVAQSDTEQIDECDSPCVQVQPPQPLPKFGSKHVRRLLEQQLPQTSTKNSATNVGRKEIPEKRPRITIRTPVQLNITDCESTEECSNAFGQFSSDFSTVAQEITGSQFDFSTIIDRKEIENGRMSKARMREEKVFKNYDPGPPSRRLYVKNVSKRATVDLLKRLFGGFVDSSVAEERMAFDVCLMSKGKLRGQAFVALATEQQAESARSALNGYLIDDKPIVIAFARSSNAS